VCAQKNGDLTTTTLGPIRERESSSAFGRGMPIGNLTSQIFANIYLSELDHWVRTRCKPEAYIRYGDDFLVLSPKLENLKSIREDVIRFLKNELSLEVNSKNDKIIKVRHGIRYLGVVIYPSGRTLSERNIKRISERLKLKNAASYRSLIEKHQKAYRKLFTWLILEKICDG